MKRFSQAFADNHISNSLIFTLYHSLLTKEIDYTSKQRVSNLNILKLSVNAIWVFRFGPKTSNCHRGLRMDHSETTANKYERMYFPVRQSSNWLQGFLSTDANQLFWLETFYICRYGSSWGRTTAIEKLGSINSGARATAIQVSINIYSSHWFRRPIINAGAWLFV